MGAAAVPPHDSSPHDPSSGGPPPRDTPPRDTPDLAGALTQTLREAQLHYLDMIDLAEAEARAIAEADVARLTEVTAEQDLLLDHLATLEVERLAQVDALARQVGVEAQGVVLTDLAGRLLPDASGPLLEAGVTLRRTAEEARALTERNRALLRDSAALVEQWMQYLRLVIAQTAGAGIAYDDSGDHAGDAPPRMLDRSA